MSAEERQVQGPRIQAMRAAVAGAIEERKAALDAAALEAQLTSEVLDLTLPAPAAPTGSVHPVSQVMDELAEIFADMGFAVATGPEIEDDWRNFTALNIPETHPARCAEEAELGDAATGRLQDWLNAGAFSLESVDRDTDRYDRKLRIVTRGGDSVGDILERSQRTIHASPFTHPRTYRCLWS